MTGRMTPQSAITEFVIPTADCPDTADGAFRRTNCGLTGITAGPDGTIWFLKANANKVGRITTAGDVSEYLSPSHDSQPFWITAGPDGNVRLTEGKTNKIGRITPGGSIQEFLIPTDFSDPKGITTGPDGYLWFAEREANKIGRLSASTGPCAPDSTTLCLRDNRFKVQLTWSKPSQPSHAGTAIPLTEDTGYFWFLNSANVELVIKVLKGPNNTYWVFYGALSSLQYTITVTDTATGAFKTYENPAGTLASVADTSAFGPSSSIVETDPEVSPEDVAARSAEELHALDAALANAAV